jgi:hypothetical protein
MQTVLSYVFAWDYLFCGYYLVTSYHGTPCYPDSTYSRVSMGLLVLRILLSYVFPLDYLLCGQNLVTCFRGGTLLCG